MRKFFKILFITLLAILLLFQFYPKHNNNKAAISGLNDIVVVHHVPDTVLQVLKTSCYDCHSNNTDYPWYANIQPVSLWLENHIKDGKKELNFSEFGGYSIRRQYNKLREINGQVKQNLMPLSSYTFIHRDARLNELQKRTIAEWATSLKDSFEANYPPDSLKRRK